jgi:hypothetical protein
MPPVMGGLCMMLPAKGGRIFLANTVICTDANQVHITYLDYS